LHHQRDLAELAVQSSAQYSRQVPVLVAALFVKQVVALVAALLPADELVLVAAVVFGEQAVWLSGQSGSSDLAVRMKLRDLQRLQFRAAYFAFRLQLLFFQLAVQFLNLFLQRLFSLQHQCPQFS